MIAVLFAKGMTLVWLNAVPWLSTSVTLQDVGRISHTRATGSCVQQPAMQLRPHLRITWLTHTCMRRSPDKMPLLVTRTRPQNLPSATHPTL